MIVKGIRLWWRQPDHYDWLTSYLRTQGLLPVLRYMLFAVMMTLAAATALTLASPSGPRELPQRIVTSVVVIALAAMALCYLPRWPTRTQSQVFAMAGTGGIAAALLSEADPRTAMIGCAAFAGLAGYVAFFHSAPYLMLTLATGLATAAVSAIRIGTAGDAPIAVAKFLTLSGGILAVPVCGRVLVHWLFIDSLKSSTDALTGLRNRRGFSRLAQDLLADNGIGSQAWISVTMIDLDGFKRLNDTLGHATGDSVLVAVAENLRTVCRNDAVIARIGGEEFLIAQAIPVDQARETDERIRQAIASIPCGVTASLGLASADLSRHSPGDLELLENLIAAADAAMYEAKRAGGNRLHQADDLIS